MLNMSKKKQFNSKMIQNSILEVKKKNTTNENKMFVYYFYII